MIVAMKPTIEMNNPATLARSPQRSVSNLVSVSTLGFSLRRSEMFIAPVVSSQPKLL